MKTKPHFSMWRRLWPFLTPHRKLFYASIVLAPLLSALNLLQPYLLKVAIDSHILKKDLAGLRVLALVYLVVFVAEYGINFLQVYIMQLTGQKVIYDLRQALFKKVQELEAAYFDKTPVGVTITRLTSDCETISELFASGIVSLGWDFLRLSLIVVAMLLLDWRLALAGFAVVPVLLGVVITFRRLLHRAYDWVREKVVELNVYIQEHVSGVRIIQLFRKENRCAQEFLKINHAYRDANMATVRYDAILYALVEGLSSIAIALLLWYGGGSLIQGAVSFGVLVAFIEYIERFFVPIRDLSAKYAIIQSAGVSIEKIFHLLERESKITSPKASQPMARFSRSLALSQVDFSYDKDRPVLQHIEYEFKRGQKIAVVGITGSGKSTLFKLLNRTYDVSAGQVILDGVDVRELPLDFLRAQFAYVPQDVFLFTGTIEENIRLFDENFSREQVVAAAQKIGAHVFIERLAQGYEHHVQSRGTNLSMGEKQLIALTRGLLFDAPILLLDEASAHVDPLTARILENAIQELGKDRTLLIAAHRLRTVRDMDLILVMHRGEIQESGTHEQLLQKSGLYSQLCRLDLVTA